MSGNLEGLERKIAKLEKSSFSWLLAVDELKLIFFIAAMVLLTFLGNYFLSDRILPGVWVAGVPVGFQTVDGAAAKLRRVLPNEVKVEIGQTSFKLNLASAGISAEYQTAVVRAFQVGRTVSWWKTRSVHLPVDVNGANLVSVVGQRVTSLGLPAKEPRLTIDNGQITEVAGQNGQTLDLTNLSAQVIQVISGQTRTLQLAVTDLTPKGSADQLAQAKQTAEQWLGRPIIVSAASQKNGLTNIQKGDLVRFVYAANQYQMVFDEGAIGALVDGIANKVERKAAPQVRDPSGNITDQGSDGVKLDRAKAVQTLKQAFSNSTQNEIQLATTGVPKTVLTVTPSYTIGQYPGKYIEVDLSSQTLYQIEGNNVVGTHKVSTGKWSTPTPVGTFAINSKSPRAYSAEFGLYMPWWMAFIGSSYGLHELPEWPNGYKEGEGHLGTPVSHGCIRLGVGDAKTVYDWVDIGTPVLVHQ